MLFGALSNLELGKHVCPLDDRAPSLIFLWPPYPFLHIPCIPHANTPIPRATIFTGPCITISLSLSLRNTMRLKSRVLSLQLCATRHTTVSFTNGPLPKGNFEYGSKLWEVSGCVECIKSGQKQGDMLLIVPEGAYARGQDLCPRGDIKRLGCTQHQHRRHSLTPVRRREPGRAPLLSIC